MIIVLLDFTLMKLECAYQILVGPEERIINVVLVMKLME